MLVGDDPQHGVTLQLTVFSTNPIRIMWIATGQETLILLVLWILKRRHRWPTPVGRTARTHA